jgi:hypothetical protein
VLNGGLYCVVLWASNKTSPGEPYKNEGICLDMAWSRDYNPIRQIPR